MTQRTAKTVQRVRAALIREGDVIQMQSLFDSGWHRVETIETSASGKTIHFRAQDLSYRVARVNTLIGVRR